MKDFRHMRDLLDTVRKTTADHRMIERGSGVVVGLSGGPDSAALAHVLQNLAIEGDFWIAAAHLDHGLRPESHLDAACAEGLAKRLGIPIRMKKEDVGRLAKFQGVSIEEAGRWARYAFFEEVRASLGAAVIATAHHADDQVETFLLRIFRGSSVQGLGGIPPVRQRIIRPLARLTREEILDYVKRHDIEYRVDETNLDVRTDRNFIRNRLIPVILERFPGFRSTVGRTVELIRQEEELLDDLSAQLATQSISREGDEVILDIAALRDAPPALASRVVLSALYELSGPETRWGRIHIQAALKLIRNANPSARACMPDHILLLREYDKLRIVRTAQGDVSNPIDISLSGPGTVEIVEAGMTLVFGLIDLDSPSAPPEEPTVEWFDADRVTFPLRIRGPLPGDRIRPWGMQGSRKIKEILIDAKIPARSRKTFPLVLSGDEILLVPGIRRSRAAAIEPATRRVLVIELEEHPAPDTISPSRM